MLDKDNVVFDSRYAEIAEEYITYKQSLGFSFGYNDKRHLNRLLKYLYSQGSKSDPLVFDENIVINYFKSETNSPRTVHSKQSFIRQFAIFLNNVKGIEAYIYPQELIKTEKNYIPRIFSTDEIIRMFETCNHLKYDGNSYQYNYLIFPALLRVLYCCGLRLGEALKLKVDNVDLNSGIITICNGKNNVSRLIPISDSLKEYLIIYDNNLIRKNNYFFPAVNGYMNPGTVRKLYHRTLKEAGIDGRASNGQSRIHDLRHNFAIHTLENVINLGMDPYCSLPILSVYMGHKGIESTEIYLRLTKHYFVNFLNYSKKDADYLFPEVTDYE